MKPRPAATIAGFALLLAAAVSARLLIGGHANDPAVLEIRGVRVLCASLVGAALSVSGVMLQSLLRNPLASPDLLGLASGSGFAVLLGVYLGVVGAGAVSVTGLGAASAALAAVIGAVAALSLTYILGRRRGVLDPVLLILNGVVVSIVCSAGSMLLRHLLPYQQSAAAERMMVGALREDISAAEFWVVGALTVLGVCVGVACGRAMDALSLSEDEARSVGVPVAGLRRVLFITSGVLTAGSVVLAGPIGFIGLLCPHVVRQLAGPSHRALIAGSALAGASLMVLADIVVRAVQLPTGRLPIGVLTALLGGPAFVWLLRKREI